MMLEVGEKGHTCYECGRPTCDIYEMVCEYCIEEENEPNDYKLDEDEG